MAKPNNVTLASKLEAKDKEKHENVYTSLERKEKWVIITLNMNGK